MRRMDLPRLPRLRRSRDGAGAGRGRTAPRTAVLSRQPSRDDGVRGALVLQDGPRLATMEPPWRENRRNRSCIPPGEYDAHPHRSPRFGACFIVAAVPDRSHILFHAGNLGGDVERGLRTHTLGCILPGMRAGSLAVGGRRQRAVLASRPALRALMGWAAGAPFRLLVREAA